MAKEIYSPKPLINVSGELWDLSHPRVMGILNITPDSFYKGSRADFTNALVMAEKMVKEGADIIDIGGVSTRPGAGEVSSQQEVDRVLPVIEKIKANIDITLSIDTYRSEVAEAAVRAGAAIINDVSGGEIDNAIWKVAVDHKVPYILMHMRGTPQNMHQKTDYHDVTLDIIDALQRKVFELNQLGLNDIIIDPGFGFSKTLDQNYVLLNHLDYLKMIGRPILIGLSRKSMIYRELGLDAEEALNGTSGLNMVALQKGASILRVHDVLEAKEMVKLYLKLKESN